jgi:hypothetical protein
VSQWCNIRVEDAYFDSSASDSEDGKLTLNQIKVLAEKFDLIYPYETAIFGYEQGEGLAENLTCYKGPTIYNPLFFIKAVYEHSPVVQSLNEWQKVYGDLTIELQKSASPAIEMYLMVR